MRPAEQRLPSGAQSPQQVYSARAWVCARYHRHQRQNHKHLLNKQLGSSPMCTALAMLQSAVKSLSLCHSSFKRFWLRSVAPILHQHKKKLTAPSASYCNSPESFLAGVYSHAVTQIVPLNTTSTTCIHTQKHSQLSIGHDTNRYEYSSFLCFVHSTGSSAAGRGWARQGE